MNTLQTGHCHHLPPCSIKCSGAIWQRGGRGDALKVDQSLPVNISKSQRSLVRFNYYYIFYFMVIALFCIKMKDHNIRNRLKETFKEEGNTRNTLLELWKETFREKSISGVPKMDQLGSEEYMEFARPQINDVSCGYILLLIGKEAFNPSSLVFGKSNQITKIR